MFHVYAVTGIDEVVLVCVLRAWCSMHLLMNSSVLCVQGLVFQLWSVCSGFGVPTLVCLFRVWCSNSGLCVQGLVFHACVGELILVCVLRIWCSNSGLCVQGLVFHADVDELCSVCSGSGVPCMC